ncbi:MAG: hypothetical protein IKX51_07805, partial [Bacteroidales bacterium]|nr:hypothetical protein [Bacteroidales bacterium]
VRKVGPSDFFCVRTKYYTINIVITKLSAIYDNPQKNNDIEIERFKIYNWLSNSCLRFGIYDALLHQGG